MVSEDEAGVAPNESDILKAHRDKLACSRSEPRTMHFDSQNSMIRVALREMNEMISHTESDLDEGGASSSKGRIEVDHFIVCENDSEVFPAIPERPLLSFRELALVPQIAGGPPEAAVTFQVRHEKRGQTKVAS